MEKYGQVPKKFTKEWWEWLWEYYKLHICVTLVVLFATGLTIYQVKTKIHYDLYITYMGTSMPIEGQTSAIEDEWNSILPDVNGNGKTEVFFQTMTDLGENASSVLGGQSVEYTAAIETKKTVELQMGESFVFIISKHQMDTWYAHGLTDDVFVPSDVWLSNKDVEKAPDAAANCFVKLPEGNPLEKNGFAADEELYIAVRSIRDNEDEDEVKKIQQAAFTAADYAVNGR